MGLGLGPLPKGGGLTKDNIKLLPLSLSLLFSRTLPFPIGMGRIVDSDETGYRTIRKTGFKPFFVLYTIKPQDFCS